MAADFSPPGKTPGLPQGLGLARSMPGVFDGAWRGSGAWLDKRTPITGGLLGRVRQGTAEAVAGCVAAAQAAQVSWRRVPAPVRGQLIREFGEILRGAKRSLGRLISIESGKLLAEGEGEVQEMIDICDFALGLSRQLPGSIFPSERPGHRLFEQWHPLGVVGIVSAFNFPAAVWAWNSVVACICGNACVWKPSEKAPFTAIACTRLVHRACRKVGADPSLFTLCVGGAEVGRAIAADPRVPLVSATGSARMGREVAATVAARLGRSLLELGGNNAMIVTESANLDLAARALLFGAVGTAGQRCTTTRRLLVHESVRGPLLERLLRAYRSIRVGNPLRRGVLVGPLIDGDAVARMQDGLVRARAAGSRLLIGGEALGGCYVRPAILDTPRGSSLLREEIFAPLLHVCTWSRLEEAIEMQNDVPQGLSSAIITRDLVESERFLGPEGSDCGLAYVNVGTSGAEIGGAFGGEKETGGGRESGSDSWKAYMRRQTVAINGTTQLPLAQGIRFGDAD